MKNKLSLQNKAISSIKWTTLQTIIVGVFGPATLIIKARYLSPEEFAYVAIINLIIGLFNLFEDFGISQAVIQRDKINKEESSSLFYFNILFCVLVAVALYFLSPLIAEFFSLPKLNTYLPLISIIVLLSGPTLLFRAFLQKGLYFKHLSIIAIIRSLLILISLTVFLVTDLGVKAVIFGNIIGSLFTAFAIIFVAMYFRLVKISFYFMPRKILPFLRFGLFVLLKQIFTFIAHRVDEVVIGYFLAPEVLGIYHFGKNMLLNIRSIITSSFGKVLYPVLSKLKNHKERLAEAYLKISRYIAFGSFPIFTGIALTAHYFVPVVFGAEWIDSVIVFQVFSITMIFLVLTANVATSLLLAINKPAELLYIDLITNTIYFISLFLVAVFGMKAILLAYSFYVVYKTVILQIYASRQLKQSFKTYLNELRKPFIISLLMAMPVLIFQFTAGRLMGDISVLICSVFIGTAFFILLAWRLEKKTIMDLKRASFKGEFNNK